MHGFAVRPVSRSRFPPSFALDIARALFQYPGNSGMPMRMNRLVALLFGSIITVASAGDPPARSSLDADPHLVGWWKFDETAGQSAADSCAQPHAGALEGGASFATASAPGRVGAAIKLDGKDQCIRITGYKGITGTKPRTVAAWIKTAAPGGEIVSWGLGDAGKMFNVCFIRGASGSRPGVATST